MTRSQVLAAIPHREPFLFVDEIVEHADRFIHCRHTFGEDAYFYRGHYPGRPITPGVLLCEAAMQAGAILLASQGVGGDGRLPVATRMNDVRFKRIVRPGETIDIKVELVERLADAYFLKASVTCQGKIALRLEFGCTLAQG